MDPEGRAPPAVNDQRHRLGASARFASSGGANGAAAATCSHTPRRRLPRDNLRARTALTSGIAAAVPADATTMAEVRDNTEKGWQCAIT
jgi:hypothetical protein